MRKIHHRLYRFCILVGVTGLASLLGIVAGYLIFDWDHLLAWLLGIDNGRFLHEPQVVIFGLCAIFLYCWLFKFLRGLYYGLKRS